MMGYKLGSCQMKNDRAESLKKLHKQFSRKKVERTFTIGFVFQSISVWQTMQMKQEGASTCSFPPPPSA